MRLFLQYTKSAMKMQSYKITENLLMLEVKHWIIKFDGQDYGLVQKIEEAPLVIKDQMDTLAKEMSGKWVEMTVETVDNTSTLYRKDLGRYYNGKKYPVHTMTFVPIALCMIKEKPKAEKITIIEMPKPQRATILRNSLDGGHYAKLCTYESPTPKVAERGIQISAHRDFSQAADKIVAALKF